MSRHVKVSHKIEVAEVMVLKQSQPVNPFVDSRKRKAGNDETIAQDPEVVEPPEKQSTSPREPVNPSTSANEPTSATRTQSLDEMMDRIADYGGGYLNIGLLYVLYFKHNFYKLQLVVAPLKSTHTTLLFGLAPAGDQIPL